MIEEKDAVYWFMGIVVISLIIAMVISGGYRMPMMSYSFSFMPGFMIIVPLLIIIVLVLMIMILTKRVHGGKS